MSGTSGAQVFGGGSGDNSDDDVQATTGGQAQVDLTATDDLLDEIDGLLEDNAEEFVRSYVQKGGE